MSWQHVSTLAADRDDADDASWSRLGRPRLLVNRAPRTFERDPFRTKVACISTASSDTGVPLFAPHDCVVHRVTTSGNFPRHHVI